MLTESTIKSEACAASIPSKSQTSGRPLPLDPTGLLLVADHHAAHSKPLRHTCAMRKKIGGGSRAL
ncbi:hypothetical protein DQG23_31225 [Paenibacillus contaminans]|uniref:Uncharacterized protein n=1 Tax=Paenibacillus contaminans TaxID=450362 RepID=A0A329M4W4_9BACL|nr:hypothetical protein DQG23_31225 [Paenibacillus contaminans]